MTYDEFKKILSYVLPDRPFYGWRVNPEQGTIYIRFVCEQLPNETQVRLMRELTDKIPLGLVVEMRCEPSAHDLDALASHVRDATGIKRWHALEVLLDALLEAELIDPVEVEREALSGSPESDVFMRKALTHGMLRAHALAWAGKLPLANTPKRRGRGGGSGGRL